MKTLPEKLEALAAILDKKAVMYDGIAEDHEMNRETEQGRNARRRSASARSYAEVSREAAKALTTRQKATAKRAAFVPPTWSDVFNHTLNKFPKWLTSDVEAWFNHFQSVGWKVGSGKQMIDWKAAAANGYRNWLEKNPQAAPKSEPKDPSPSGWREFLVAQNQPYRPIDAVQSWLREEFKEGRK